jgi:asparagine synthase (glutamine-hydrolysing)
MPEVRQGRGGVCGIAGIKEATSDVPSMDVLLSMAGELEHRGPDGVGVLLDPGVALVNTRLSVIDVASGDQPLSDDSGRYWVVQNGEIYNHIELRAELESFGHRFSTRCDTEVIAHAYARWGVACLHRFIGPFAIAIWDRHERSLLLARDRFGVRPLFLAERGSRTVFSSEIKALLRHPAVERTLDPVGIVDTYTVWSPLPDRTAFAGVRELPPGTYLRIDAQGRTDERAWWQLQFEPRGTRRAVDQEQLADELEELLVDATRLRLRADVPVATYLSGGLDSSTITALATTHGAQPPQCFGLRFSDVRYDEGPEQQRVATALGVELDQITVDAADIAAALPRVVELSEAPLLRTAPAPMLMLSGKVRAAGYKVVLTGEGADELFAGYDVFREAQIRRFWARNPNSQMRPRLLERIYPWLNRSTTAVPSFARQFFGTALDRHDDPLFSHRVRITATQRCLRFLAPHHVTSALENADTTARLLAMLPSDFDKLSTLAQAQQIEILTFLQGYLLHSQGDRMLMGNSVEGRFPFLDHRVAEFAARLPDTFRLCGLHDKALLRRVAKRVVPHDIASRPKQPYRAPVAAALVGPDSPDYVERLLSPERIAGAGFLRPDVVQLLLTKCRRNLDGGVSEMDEMALVGALSIQLLHDVFIANPPPPRAPHADRIVRHGVVLADRARALVPEEALR